MSVNKVIIVGRLGTDPEVRYTSNGTAVANFNVATNEFWTGKDGQKQERTEWHRMVVWGKQAELAKQYLSKGREAYFEGTLQTRNWEDQQGNKRYTTEIKVQNMRFLGGGASDSPNYSSNGNDRSQSDYGSQAPSYESSSQPMKEPSFTDDDIPF